MEFNSGFKGLRHILVIIVSSFSKKSP